MVWVVSPCAKLTVPPARLPPRSAAVDGAADRVGNRLRAGGVAGARDRERDGAGALVDRQAALGDRDRDRGRSVVVADGRRGRVASGSMTGVTTVPLGFDSVTVTVSSSSSS